MRWSAPRDFAMLSLASEEEVAMTTAPAAWAIWRAKMETPPVPCTTTTWPGSSGLREYSAFHAYCIKHIESGGTVTPAQGSVEASLNGSQSGIFTSDISLLASFDGRIPGKTLYSCSTPSICPPNPVSRASGVISPYKCP